MSKHYKCRCLLHKVCMNFYLEAQYRKSKLLYVICIAKLCEVKHFSNIEKYIKRVTFSSGERIRLKINVYLYFEFKEGVLSCR